jgi:DNA-binding transcriptional ArsR family regulator
VPIGPILRAPPLPLVIIASLPCSYRDCPISYLTEMEERTAASTEALSGAPFALGEAPSRVELLGKYFRGLGDPTRLRILRLLEKDGELSAGEIVSRVGLPQATVSTHLGCLRWCGFVNTRRENRSVIYRVADRRVGELVRIADSLLEDNAQHVACCTTIDDAKRSAPYEPSAAPHPGAPSTVPSPS